MKILSALISWKAISAYYFVWFFGACIAGWPIRDVALVGLVSMLASAKADILELKEAAKKQR